VKSNKKKIVILLILGLAFPIVQSNNFNFSVEQPTFNNPKTSSIYNGGILIDVFLTTNTSYSGNWTWAVSQPWCYDDNGVYVIEDLTINASTSPTGSGIYIVDSDNEYFIIRNCTVFDAGSGINDGGIRLEETNNGTLANNNCSNNVGNGIYLDTNCKNNTISGNTANNNDAGIYLFLGSDNNTISGNTANNNADYGIYLYEFCNYNTISNNEANENDYSGISLEYQCYYNTISGNIANNSGDYGIYLYDSCGYNTISNNFVNGTQGTGISLHWYSSNNTILDNIANYNEEIGIELYDYCENNTVLNNIVSFNGLNGIGIYDVSNYNILTENLLFNNTFGVYIDNGDNNSIYENFFSKNFKHAFDDGIDNIWNNTVIGNYWDNHTGPDTSPQDGIVDTPYTYIGGPAGSIDYLPIAEDGTPIITINSPHEGGRFGNTAPSFTITVTDIYVVSMWYTLDDGQHNYTFTGFAGTFAQSAWDAMSDGTITIKFYAIDLAGNIGTAEITIGKNLPEEFDPTLVIVIVSIVGGVAVVAVVYIFMKKRATP